MSAVKKRFTVDLRDVGELAPGERFRFTDPTWSDLTEVWEVSEDQPKKGHRVYIRRVDPPQEDDGRWPPKPDPFCMAQVNVVAVVPRQS